MYRKIFFWVLVGLGVLNSLIIVFSALIGQNSYIIAESISNYFYIVLGWVPFCIVCTAFVWFVIDKLNKVDSKINYFAIAFFGILSDAIFAIGSIFFISK